VIRETWCHRKKICVLRVLSGFGVAVDTDAA